MGKQLGGKGGGGSFTEWKSRMKAEARPRRRPLQREMQCRQQRCGVGGQQLRRQGWVDREAIDAGVDEEEEEEEEETRRCSGVRQTCRY